MVITCVDCTRDYKIELSTKYIFIRKNGSNTNSLIKFREKGIYVVKKENGIYKGTYYIQRGRTFIFPYIILTHVTLIKNGEKYKIPDVLF